VAFQTWVVQGMLF